MWVKISSTKAQNLSPVFDESINRTTRDLDYEDWGEYMVAWRKDHIEIYEDYVSTAEYRCTEITNGKPLQSTSLHEWAVGHKHLAYVIPLKCERTHMSLYSFVDMTFCITCPPTRSSIHPKKSKRHFTQLDGTNVYIFKNKSRSRTYDWVWQLWCVFYDAMHN